MWRAPDNAEHGDSYFPRINGPGWVTKTAAPGARPSCKSAPGGGGPGADWMVSGGSDGERVEVVGQDAPADRCLGAGLAFEAGAAEAVAAFEVADAAFGADAVARQAPVGASGAGAAAAGDEHAAGVGKRVADGAGIEAGVQRNVARAELEPLELGGCLGQQRVFFGIADRCRRGQDQAACAAARVLGDLGDLKDVAELVRDAELAAADRACVGVGERHEPIGDRLAGRGAW